MKYIKILAIMILFITPLFADSNVLNIDGGYNMDILGNPMNRTNDINLVVIPMDMFKPTKPFTIAWIPNSINGKLYYSQNSGGRIITNYTATNITGTIQNITTTNGQVISARTINTTAQAIGIGVGIYYCVIHDPTNNYTSMEFQLIIESASGVTTSQPGNGSTITNNPIPTFIWQPIAGIPYYHVMVSDQPFTLSYDENDKLVVSGLNLVWQAITPNNSISYASYDPSDNFNHIVAPPLITGKEYNWIVMSNFGNDPLYSSDVSGNPSGFFYHSTTTLPTPVLTAPVNNAVFNNQGTLTFQWDDIPDAVTYHVFVYERRNEAGSEVLYPVWNEITTDNIVEFEASNILIQSSYVWKVIATNENSVSSVSQVRNFQYNTPTGTLNISIFNREGVGLGNSQVVINAVEGSMDNIPLTVNEFGREKKFLPTGYYLLSFSKNGYETKDTLITVVLDPLLVDEPSGTGDTKVTVYLDYSPAFLIGSVMVNNVPLSNVLITTTKSDGEVRTAVASNGSYHLAVTPGFWTITAQKESYLATNNAQTTISAGQSVNLSNINMVLNTKNISGYTKLPNNTAIASVTIKATKGSNIYTKISNNTGFYEFTGLEPGVWTISWTKTGYTAPANYSLTINSSSPTNTQMTDATMTPRANVINGNAGNGSVGLANCTITATPSSGTPVITTSNEYGNYTLNVPQGNYTIVATKTGYTAQSNRLVNVTVGETINSANFILYPNLSYINGTVLSGTNPISGVTITAGTFTALTDAAGYYNISVSSGTYNLTAQKTGYITGSNQNIAVGPGQTSSGINFSLSPNPGVISGKALLNGVGVASASITGNRVSGSTLSPISPITSDQNGNYTLNLIAGTYQLTASKSGMISNTINVTVAAGANISQQNITMQLNQATINGTIYNDQGSVVRNTNIQIYEYNNIANSFSTVTNIYGAYTVTVPAGVRYVISASKTGYSSNSFTMTSAITIGTTLSKDLTITGQNAQINGKVFDQNNIAITNATLTATSGSSSVQTSTSATGAYSLALNYGNWNLNVSKPGYSSADSIYVINPGEILNNKNFKINTNFATLNGRIISSPNSANLQNATITATNSIGGGGSAVSNQNGEYTIANLIPGSYTITVNRSNYNSASVNNLTLSGNATTTKNFTMTPMTGTLNITCNQNNATISIENTSTGSVQNYVTENTLTVLSGQTTQTQLNISISKTNYYPQTQSVTLAANGSQDITFTLIPATGSIAGRIINSTGDGLANVQVNAVSSNGFSGSAITQANGNYTISNLQTGNTFNITASLANYNQSGTLSVNLQSTNPNVTNQNITMTPNNITISGIVKNQLGTALANVPVKAVSNEIVIQTTTNASGQFSLTSLSPNRTYNVSTQKSQPGWDNTSTNVTALLTNISNVELAMTIHTSSISGIITNQQTGAVIAGATITTYNSNLGISRTLISQSDGSYSISNMYAGTLRITVSKESYQSTIEENIALGYDQALVKNKTLTYSAPVSVSGSLKDTNNRVIANTAVYLTGSNLNLNTLTDNQGLFTFNNVTPYLNNLVVSTALNSQYYNNATNTFNTSNQNVTDINLQIDVHNASINGVVNNNTSLLLNNALVKLTRLSDNSVQTFLTLADGAYTFDNLYEGDYILTITRAGYISYTSSTISLVDAQNLSSNNITLTNLSGSIAGIVENNQRAIIKNAVVILTNQTTQATTQALSGEDGSFVFSNIQSLTSYTITASKTGYNAYTHVNALALDSTNVHVNLTGINNSILGTIRYEGNVIPNATIKARNNQGNLYTTTADTYGDYSLPNLIGFYKVWAFNDELTSYWQEITVPTGDYVIADIDLVQAASIPGRVTYGNQGVSAVSIIATNIYSGRVFNTNTNSNGLFKLSGMPGATYLIQAQKDGYNINETFPTVQVLSGQTADSLYFSLAFNGNTIAGSTINNLTQEPISGVSITLKQNNQILNTAQSTTSGSFTFTGIIDGNYVVEASHPAYLAIEPISVVVSNGQSTPAMVQFNMQPQQKVIFGNITDSNQEPLIGATAKAIQNETEYTAVSDVNGNYSISVPEYGAYTIQALKNYFTSSSIVNVNLSTSNPAAEVNFQLSQLPAAIGGMITITDMSGENPIVENPQSLIISLSILGQDDIVTDFGNSSLYQINNINLPVDNYAVQLKVEAVYNGTTFKKIQDLNLEPGAVSNFNYNFNFIPNSVNLGGFVKMKLPDNSLIPLPNASIILRNQAGIIDTVNTGNEGYYQFNSLVQDNYSLDIKSVYDFETFNQTINNISWTGEDLAVDHTFNYSLSSYEITLVDEMNLPIQYADVRITGSSLTQPISLITNEFGKAVSDSVLHSGQYSVKITAPVNQTLCFINPNAYNIEFTAISLKQDQKRLPLRFDRTQINPVASTDSIRIKLNKATNYNDIVSIIYRDANNQTIEQLLDQTSSPDTLSTIIPSQGRSGSIEFYFVSYSSADQLTYNSQNEPLNWLITAEGIISANNSMINPVNSMLTFNQRLRFNINLKDELENLLNEDIDSRGNVTWSLADSTLGSLNVVTGSKRTIDYISPVIAENYSVNQIKARVELDGNVIFLSANITLKEMRLNELFIVGADEVSNTINSNLYRIVALSDSGEVMTVEAQMDSIGVTQGALAIDGDQITYTPNDSYIGLVNLKITAKDPNFEHIVETSKSINVYKMILPNNPADTLYTGAGCQLLLPANMLANGTANIYIQPILTSPVQYYGTSYDVESKVFQTSSSGNPNFTAMPGIAFDFINLDNVDLKKVAYWDMNKMQWVFINPTKDRNPSRAQNIIIEQIPGWYQYALLSPAKALGLYDLKLLPNPFTPNDQIGSNNGLQISFKISSKNTRYPKVTCKVYNLNGTLVKTIANQKAFLKGDYKIGESTSLYWDGKTDDNRIARNGRYVIHLVVEDAKDRKEYVKPIVLIK